MHLSIYIICLSWYIIHVNKMTTKTKRKWEKKMTKFVELNAEGTVKERTLATEEAIEEIATSNELEIDAHHEAHQLSKETRHDADYIFLNQVPKTFDGYTLEKIYVNQENELYVMSGDMNIEERVTELEAVLKGDQTKMSDEEIVALEEEYMLLTGEDEIRY